MTYSVFLLPGAKRDLDLFKGALFAKLCKVICGPAKEPRPLGSLKLTGDGGYRIRIADYRILYRIDDQEKKVFVYRVRHRREVYR